MLQDAEASLSGFEKPIVGIHVRRTDKVGTEAAFHAVEEYMKYVSVFSCRFTPKNPDQIKKSCTIFLRLKSISKGSKSKVAKSSLQNACMLRRMMPKSWLNAKRSFQITRSLVTLMWQDLPLFPRATPAIHYEEYCPT